MSILLALLAIGTFLGLVAWVLILVLWDPIANALIKRAQKTPYRHTKDYMNRWWLLPYAKWRPAVRIHQILRSDDDRAFHDHPWNFITIILRGGYVEVRPLYDKSGLLIGESRVRYKAGAVLFRRAKDWHRLELRKGEHAWTLFITFRKRQGWGFLVKPDFKTYYRDYE